MEIPKGITGISRDVEALEEQLAESKQLGRVIGITFVVLASDKYCASMEKCYSGKCCPVTSPGLCGSMCLGTAESCCGTDNVICGPGHNNKIQAAETSF